MALTRGEAEDAQALSDSRSKLNLINILEYLNASAILTIFSSTSSQLTHNLLRYTFYPFALILTTINYLLLAKQLLLERNLLGKSPVESLTASGVQVLLTSAIITPLTFRILFDFGAALFGPLILFAAIAVKSVSELILGVGFYVMAKRCEKNITDSVEVLKARDYRNRSSQLLLNGFLDGVIAVSLLSIYTYATVLVYSTLAATTLAASVKAWFSQDNSIVCLIKTPRTTDIAYTNSTLSIHEALQIRQGIEAANAHARDIIPEVANHEAAPAYILEHMRAANNEPCIYEFRPR
jgi:hypothetical protein